MSDYPILSLITFLPLVGAILILLVREARVVRWIALLATLATLLLSLPLYQNFDRSSPALQFVESAQWIPSWNISYRLGVDGISLPFVFLATLLSPLCVAASWKAVKEKEGEFYAALLVAETAMVGLFAAADLFLFFVFWELMIVPVFLLIGVWGGPGRVYASVKFLLFTLAGSVFMLVGIIALYQAAGTLELRALSGLGLSSASQIWLFLAFLAAFAVKVPMFPLHTWLPDAHTEAPTAGSVILAGILLKMGAYGFLRIALPILPEGVRTFLFPLLVISAVAIVYGAYVTLVQTDVKRLIAFSSVSHMGFVTLGIFTLDPRGVEGAILQMVNHGIISAALFLCFGMIYERTHSRDIQDYGGVVKLAPVYTSFLALFCLAGSGFPGLNSFVGEFLIIGGAFRTELWLGGLAIWGVVLGTAYLVRFYYRVALGEVNASLSELKLELTPREVAVLLPLASLTLALGLYPEWVLSYVRVPVAQLLAEGGLP